MFVHRFLGKLRLLTLALPLGLSLMLSLPLTASAHALWEQQVFFKQKNLASSSNFPGPNIPTNHTDDNLINSWGIVAVPHDGPFWIVGNDHSVASAYDGQGNNLHKVINIGTDEGPTGVVLNQMDDFVITNPITRTSAPATLLFATESGKIFGWNKRVDPNNAIPAPLKGQSTTAVYKGLALGHTRFGDFLFVTNFHDGTIDVFNSQFTKVDSFTDKDFVQPCSHPAPCFAPFGIRTIEGKLFVTFALQDDAKHDDDAAPGRGFVDFLDLRDPHGKFVLKRLISGEPLDSPWGLEQAPDDFGQFRDALLVGNFGDGANTQAGFGSINAFNINTGEFLGSLRDKQGHLIFISGLWGLTLGDDARNARPDDLYFAAGPADVTGTLEATGLFGFLEPED